VVRGAVLGLSFGVVGYSGEHTRGILPQCSTLRSTWLCTRRHFDPDLALTSIRSLNTSAYELPNKNTSVSKSSVSN
jgi:hypothetical protein